MDDLSPCPFCGGTDFYIDTLDEIADCEPETFFVVCRQCEAEGPTATLESHAKRLWNYREEEK
jgi:Lar family restriction alleviation protein